jgi:hypothetical protein
MRMNQVGSCAAFALALMSAPSPASAAVVLTATPHADIGASCTFVGVFILGSGCPGLTIRGSASGDLTLPGGGTAVVEALAQPVGPFAFA